MDISGTRERERRRERDAATRQQKTEGENAERAAYYTRITG